MISPKAHGGATTCAFAFAGYFNRFNIYFSIIPFIIGIYEYMCFM